MKPAKPGGKQGSMSKPKTSNEDSAGNGDPRPVPPQAPGNDDCCHGGCAVCVFDLYSEELERYEAALKAWEARQAAR